MYRVPMVCRSFRDGYNVATSCGSVLMYMLVH